MYVMWLGAVWVSGMSRWLVLWGANWWRWEGEGVKRDEVQWCVWVVWMCGGGKGRV